jgi:hypothetical protein
LLEIVYAKRRCHFIERGEETMTRRAIAIFMLLASLSFAASSLLALQDNNGDDKWQPKGKYEYRVYRLRPTDWPQGTKQPWQTCGTPPAGATKDDCKSVFWEGRYIYYYPGKGGTIYARRGVTVPQPVAK